jgi:hypothetical protein
MRWIVAFLLGNSKEISVLISSEQENVLFVWYRLKLAKDPTNTIKLKG